MQINVLINIRAVISALKGGVLRSYIMIFFMKLLFIYKLYKIISTQLNDI